MKLELHHIAYYTIIYHVCYAQTYMLYEMLNGMWHIPNIYQYDMLCQSTYYIGLYHIHIFIVFQFKYYNIHIIYIICNMLC